MSHIQFLPNAFLDPPARDVSRGLEDVRRVEVRQQAFNQTRLLIWVTGVRRVYPASCPITVGIGSSPW